MSKKLDFEIKMPSKEEMDKIRKKRHENARINPNCMSNWLPLVKDLEINQPETILIENSLEEYEEEFFKIFDGKNEKNLKLDSLSKKIKNKAKKIGYPLFMKTGTFSAKHSWKNTCFVLKEEDIFKHYLAILHEQYCVGAASSHFLALREVINVETDLHAFSDMPITKERRYFFKEGKVVGHHPYWPPEALENYNKDVDWKNKISKINKEDKKEVLFLKEKSLLVGEKLSKLYPNWSIDWLQDKKGNWYLIDVAVMEQSFIWKDYKDLKKYL